MRREGSIAPPRAVRTRCARCAASSPLATAPVRDRRRRVALSPVSAAGGGTSAAPVRRAHRRVGHSGAAAMRHGDPGARASALWNSRSTVQAAVTPGGSTRAAARTRGCARDGLAGDTTGQPAAASVAGLRKPRSRCARVLRWAVRAGGRPVTDALRPSAESAALQIESHVVPSQRGHNADQIPGSSPERSISDLPPGAAFVKVNEIPKEQKTEIAN